jgi:hypothetical protein
MKYKFLVVAAMISLFSAELVADDKPSSKTPESRPSSSQNKTWGVDEIMSFFQSGIVQGKGKHNRIYTVGEILSKFGEPAKRESRGGKSNTTQTNETWVYNCKDGTVTVGFTQVGYGGNSSSNGKNMRLQITSVVPTRGKPKSSGGR